jgi:hypothetical protein
MGATPPKPDAASPKPMSALTRTQVPSGNSNFNALVFSRVRLAQTGAGQRRRLIGGDLYRCEHRHRIWCQLAALNLTTPVPQPTPADLVRATSAHDAPSRSTSAIRSFSSNRQRRPRSTPVMISITHIVPDLNGARTSAAKITRLNHPAQAAVPGFRLPTTLRRRVDCPARESCDSLLGTYFGGCDGRVRCCLA